MEEPSGYRSIRIIEESALQWARAHPSFFFAGGMVGVEALMEQLIVGAKALGAAHVEARQSQGWCTVAAEYDWFPRARFAVPENLDALTPFPELGQNCTRPECLVAAFASDVVLRGPGGISVVRGGVAANEPVLRELCNPAWGRAIAFRGVGA